MGQAGEEGDDDGHLDNVRESNHLECFETFPTRMKEERIGRTNMSPWELYWKDRVEKLGERVILGRSIVEHMTFTSRSGIVARRLVKQTCSQAAQGSSTLDRRSEDVTMLLPTLVVQ